MNAVTAIDSGITTSRLVACFTHMEEGNMVISERIDAYDAGNNGKEDPLCVR